MPSWIQEKQTKKQSERSKPAKKQQREQEEKITIAENCNGLWLSGGYWWKVTPELKIKTKGLTTAANAHHSQSRPTVAKAKPPVPGITAFLHTQCELKSCTNMHKYKLKKNADESHISSSTWPRSTTKPCACRWTLHDLHGPGT